MLELTTYLSICLLSHPCLTMTSCCPNIESTLVYKYTVSLQGSILQKFYTCNLQVQLLFSATEIIATLVKYNCKTFITLTPAWRMNQVA